MLEPEPRGSKSSIQLEDKGSTVSNLVSIHIFDITLASVMRVYFRFRGPESDETSALLTCFKIEARAIRFYAPDIP